MEHVWGSGIPNNNLHKLYRGPGVDSRYIAATHTIHWYIYLDFYGKLVGISITIRFVPLMRSWWGPLEWRNAVEAPENVGEIDRRQRSAKHECHHWQLSIFSHFRDRNLANSTEKYARNGSPTKILSMESETVRHDSFKYQPFWTWFQWATFCCTNDS